MTPTYTRTTTGTTTTVACWQRSDGHRVSAQSVTSDQHEDDPLVLLLDGEEIPVGVILRIALKVQELGVRQLTFHEN